MESKYVTRLVNLMAQVEVEDVRAMTEERRRRFFHEFDRIHSVVAAFRRAEATPPDYDHAADFTCQDAYALLTPVRLAYDLRKAKAIVDKAREYMGLRKHRYE